MRTPSCNSPRPATSRLSLSSLSRTPMATLPSASRRSRSTIMREVTLVPSRPASGLSLTEKVIARVGGSIGSAWMATLTSGAQIEAAESEQLGEAALLDDAAVAADRLQRHVDARRAGMDAPGQHAADIGVALQGRH